MGTVWRAKDETVDREVAVKEPRVPDHLPERERANVFERMRREARAAARLDHPAVVNVHDVAVVDGRPWIVMELVHGRSLGDALQEGTLGAREAARIGLEVLGALEAAHAAGILHRDVKPDNVLLGRHDRVVLTDFGIAQIEGETNLTDTGGFVGSPEYIAPERVLGQRPGPASDLWSLGVVLYAATEGVSPFRRSNTPATLQSVLNATPAPPASAPGPLAEAINGLLVKDPAQRPRRGAGPRAPGRRRHARRSRRRRRSSRSRRRRPRGGKGVFLGRKALAGSRGVVVAAVAAGVLVAVNPFGGSDAEGWKKHTSTRRWPRPSPRPGATGGPARRPRTRTRPLGHVHRPQRRVWITSSLDKKAEDANGNIAGPAAAEMYDDDGGLQGERRRRPRHGRRPRADGTRPTGRQVPGRRPPPRTRSSTSDGQPEPPPPRAQDPLLPDRRRGHVQAAISYPGKGDFTARGREVGEDGDREPGHRQALIREAPGDGQCTGPR